MTEEKAASMVEADLEAASTAEADLDAASTLQQELASTAEAELEPASTAGRCGVDGGQRQSPHGRRRRHLTLE